MGMPYLPHSNSGSQKPKHRCQLAIIILAILIGPLTRFYVPLRLKPQVTQTLAFRVQYFTFYGVTPMTKQKKLNYFPSFS